MPRLPRQLPEVTHPPPPLWACAGVCTLAVAVVFVVVVVVVVDSAVSTAVVVRRWADFLARSLPHCGATLRVLNLGRNTTLAAPVEYFPRHCPQVELLFLNGTGLKGDAAGFAGARHLVRLDVADCPALTGDPGLLQASFGPAFTVNY